jgi:hypothetical protein
MISPTQVDDLPYPLEKRGTKYLPFVKGGRRDYLSSKGRSRRTTTTRFYVVLVSFIYWRSAPSLVV